MATASSQRYGHSAASEGERPWTPLGVLLGLTALLLGLALGYFGGRAQSGAALRELDARLATLTATHEETSRAHATALIAQQRSAQSENAASYGALMETQRELQSASTMLELHRGVYLLGRSRDALERGQYALAEGRLREAEARLGALTGTIPGLTDAVVAIARTRIVVSDDPEAQERALDAIVEPLDQVVALTETQMRDRDGARRP